MKSLKIFIVFAAMACIGLISCNQEEIDKPGTSNEVGVVELGAVLNDFLSRQQEQAIPDCSEDDPMYARVVLSYGSEEVDVVIPLIIENGDIFTDYSEDLEIPIPNEGDNTIEVSLDHFWVYAEEPDDETEPIWVAPQEGSEYENFVNDALPKVFDLKAGSKKYVDVEVLCFDDREVNLYGYQFFDIIGTELYEFCLFANYCAPRHYTANYSVDIEYIGEEEFSIYSGEMPITGNTEDDDSGDWYADPLCLAIPGPLYGETATDEYLRVTVTLEAWDDNYPTPAEEFEEVFELSWNDIESYFGDDNTIEYEHIFFNCGDDPGGEDCPITEEDSDGDCVPDQEDECPGYDDRDDMDDDGVPDACDECPEEAGSSDNFGCPLDDCTEDTDGDGVVDCEDACPDEVGPDTNEGCPVSGGDNCETAYMFGDKLIKDLGNSNRWGWAEYYEISEDGNSQTLNIYAGAGQNNINNGVLVGNATITIDGDDVNLDISLEQDVSLNELHVHLSENAPTGNTAQAPGQYNMNSEVSADQLNYIFDRPGDSFYLIVHAVSCY